jgi:hypothetical protein
MSTVQFRLPEAGRVRSGCCRDTVTQALAWPNRNKSWCPTSNKKASPLQKGLAARPSHVPCVRRMYQVRRQAKLLTRGNAEQAFFLSVTSRTARGSWVQPGGRARVRRARRRQRAARRHTTAAGRGRWGDLLPTRAAVTDARVNRGRELRAPALPAARRPPARATRGQPWTPADVRARRSREQNRDQWHKLLPARASATYATPAGDGLGKGEKLMARALAGGWPLARPSREQAHAGVALISVCSQKSSYATFF